MWEWLKNHPFQSKGLSLAGIFYGYLNLAIWAVVAWFIYRRYRR